jgi:glutathione S-transferase
MRDLRVRWALEEVDLPYAERLIEPAESKSASYRALQPFGQVPVYEEGDLVLFESGAIVHHIATRSGALMPTSPHGRARTLTWMFAALNTLELPVMSLIDVDVINAQAEWAKPRRPVVLAFLNTRLEELARWLEGREYLEDQFTAGDLLMTTVLRILRHTDLVEQTPNLEAYRLRCEARPAFKRALTGQMKTFGSSSGAGPLPALRAQ